MPLHDSTLPYACVLMKSTSDPDGLPPMLNAPLDEALAWFARLRDQQASQAEQAAFEAWLATSPAHAQAFEKVRQLWESPALPAALSHFEVPVPKARSRPRPRFQARRWMAAAGLLFMLGWGLLASGLPDRWRADYATAAGEQRSLVLADGSTVLLNTDSALALDFAGDGRGVRLLAGEAYFEVKPDSARPFTVQAGFASVRVVGTRFSVRHGNPALVEVESGTVACSNGQGKPVPLSAGQQVAIGKQAIGLPEPLDAPNQLAWVKGRLVFRDQPLAQVVRELDRYHPGAIFIARPALAQIRVTGSYKLGDSSAVLRALAGIVGARVFSATAYLIVLH